VLQSILSPCVVDRSKAVVSLQTALAVTYRRCPCLSTLAIVRTFDRSEAVVVFAHRVAFLERLTRHLDVQPSYTHCHSHTQQHKSPLPKTSGGSTLGPAGGIAPSPKSWLGPPNLVVLLTHCGQLILRKISKFDATRCQILILKCKKIRFPLALRLRPRWGSLQRSSRPPSCI